MRPRIVEFFADKGDTGIFVPDYAFMHAIAILMGIYLVIKQAEKTGLDVKKVFRACLITVGFVIVSSRLYIVFQHIEYYIQRPLEIFQYWKGGMASFGAYIGVAIAAIVATRWQGLSAAKFLDCCAPAAALATFFCRLGCFFNGCCYGKISNLPWAMCFPEDSGPYYAQLQEGLISAHQPSLPVHPTQLYEALYALLLFFGLLIYRKYQRWDGELFAVLFIMYPLGRFLNEFLRGDDRGNVFFLSLPQVFCVVAAIVAVFFLVMKKREWKYTSFWSHLNYTK